MTQVETVCPQTPQRDAGGGGESEVGDGGRGGGGESEVGDGGRGGGGES